MELDARGLVIRDAPRLIPNGPRDVVDLFARAVAARPAHLALVGRHRRFTFAQLANEVNAAIAALESLGIERGDRVAASLANQPELVIAFVAAMHIGAIWVGINTALAPPEKRHMLLDSGANLFITSPEIAATMIDAPTALRTIDPSGSVGSWVACTDGVRDASSRPVLAPIDPHEPAAIAYTSGTTGFPKGAVHSQHNMLWPGADARENDPGDPSERHGVLLPLTLLNLMVLGPLFAWQTGTTCICVDRTDPLGVRDWIRDEGITRMTFAPTMVHDLLHHPEVRVGDLVTLRRPECGGSSTPRALRDLFRERFGVRLLTGYGLTEAPTAVTRERADDAATPGCSGPPFAPIELVIVDEWGRELAPGETGEICVRSPRSGPWADVYTPFLGYWNQPDATAQALRGAMLHTGDLGMLDGDGRLFVHDRMTDVIIRGGANVYPAEVERVLLDHRGVVACSVLSITDERLGERVAAVIQRHADTDTDIATLEAYCRERLARYKVPDRWAFVDSFRRTPMGKIAKAPLRSLFSATDRTESPWRSSPGDR